MRKECCAQGEFENQISENRYDKNNEPARKRGKIEPRPCRPDAAAACTRTKQLCHNCTRKVRRNKKETEQRVKEDSCRHGCRHLRGGTVAEKFPVGKLHDNVACGHQNQRIRNLHQFIVCAGTGKFFPSKPFCHCSENHKNSSQCFECGLYCTSVPVIFNRKRTFGFCFRFSVHSAFMSCKFFHCTDAALQGGRSGNFPGVLLICNLCISAEQAACGNEKFFFFVF